MSSRIIIYYCALCGGWAAFFAWIVTAAAGLNAVESDSLHAGVLSAMAGLMISVSLGTLDSFLNISPERLARILTAVRPRTPSC